MKKIETLFKIDRNTDLALPIINPNAQWVFDGEGVATIKFDGTSAFFHNGVLYKRFNRRLKKKFARMKAKKGDSFVFKEDMMSDLPKGSIPCNEKPDPVTFHHPHWVPVDVTDPSDKWFAEALSFQPELIDGMTYELVGPKIQDNIHNLPHHQLWHHGSGRIVRDVIRTFDGIKKWLKDNNEEGLVFHHSDGRKIKIRRKDFFDFKVKHNGRKIDWRNENVIFK